MKRKLEQYLWEGLDLNRFEVLDIYPQNAKLAAIFMRSRYPKNDPLPWCVQFAGSGKYFESYDEAAAYLKNRFHVNVRPRTND